MTVSFENDQPEPARPEEARKLAFRVIALPPQERAAPAANMKTGAQKCVIQRVKKIAGVVRARSVGENDIAPR